MKVRRGIVADPSASGGMQTAGAWPFALPDRLHGPGGVLSPVFHSGDLDETRHNVGRIFKPHELTVYGRRQALDARMDHLTLGSVSLNRLGYGANVSIEPDCLEDFLLVQMPVQGRAEIRCGAQRIGSSPQQASVITPSLPLHMRWHGLCEQLIVRIERTALEDACRDQLGHALPCPLEFQLGMDLRTDYGQAWKALVQFLASSPFVHGAMQHRLVLTQIEQLLVATLINQHPHNYTALLQHAPPAAPLKYVQRAEEYMLAHSDQPISMQILAKHACISTRSLYDGFREHRGTSPMAFLKLVRLQKVRERLAQARKNRLAVSITQAALDCGFSHLGHFTQAYRKHFNETPSQTLSGKVS